MLLFWAKVLLDVCVIVVKVECGPEVRVDIIVVVVVVVVVLRRLFIRFCTCVQFTIGAIVVDVVLHQADQICCKLLKSFFARIASLVNILNTL